MTAQWARIMGAAEIFLFDIVVEKLLLATKLSFEKVFDSTKEEPIEVVNAHTDGKGRACLY